jgi:hypothetical protein
VTTMIASFSATVTTSAVSGDQYCVFHFPAASSTAIAHGSHSWASSRAANCWWNNSRLCSRFNVLSRIESMRLPRKARSVSFGFHWTQDRTATSWLDNARPQASVRIVNRHFEVMPPSCADLVSCLWPARSRLVKNFEGRFNVGQELVYHIGGIDCPVTFLSFSPRIGTGVGKDAATNDPQSAIVRDANGNFVTARLADLRIA